MTAEAHPASRTVPPRSERRGGTRAFIALLVTFLLIFPKGGIRVADVPITWGYLLLGIAALYLPFALLRGSSVRVPRENLLLVAALVPFQLVIWVALIVNGTIGIGFTISLLITFFFVPLVFLLVLGPPMERSDLDFLLRWVRAGILFVAAYGIFLFFYRLGTGSFLEIPYLTVNAGDFGELDGEKFIDRGGIFKLISTYNNGNIYGVCLLMLLPLYAFLERRTLPQLVVKLSLVLTLSRTVWIGLVFFEVVHRLYVKRLSLRSVATLAIGLLLLVAGVAVALQLMETDISFLLDPNLGGRVQQFEALNRPTVLPGKSFEHVLEVVYISILDTFGLVGLLGYVGAMTAPLVLQNLGATHHGGTEYKRSLAAGLVIYLFVSLSDGALLFIPVAAFFWFIATLLVSPLVPSFGAHPGPQRLRGHPAAAGARPPLVALQSDG